MTCSGYLDLERNFCDEDCQDYYTDCKIRNELEPVICQWKKHKPKNPKKEEERSGKSA
jgi:hypothetical protein